MARVLLIDDDRNLREVVGFMLGQAGHEVLPAGSAEDGLARFARGGADLVITDVRMPGRDGLHVLAEVAPTGTPVVVLTAHGTVSQAVAAMRAGASSYLLKPFERDELLVTVEKALQEGALRRDNAALRALLQRRRADHGLVFRSTAMTSLVEQARQLAASDAPALITGESGTGKELIARLLHRDSPRWEQAFVAVNCGAISGELAESELFGHVRGAFTGADRDHQGRMRAAHGGTLFLDEIGELPPSLQPKLLRALEARHVDPVGAIAPEPADFRLVCATNRDLAQAARDGTFRDDLYYRVAVVVLRVPPLRERPDDVDPLWDHFTQLHGGEGVTTTEALREVLRTRPWPGNVRELRNLNQRLVVLRRGPELDVADLQRIQQQAGEPAAPPAAITSASQWLAALPPSGLDLPQLERQVIEHALVRFAGNKTRAAEYLGIPRHVLIYRLKKYADQDG
ncbi:MAG: sigma-54 dependent transcriptional regulator [Candidatus Krumholzibacteriia bacterium]